MILDEICAHKKTEVETCKSATPIEVLEERVVGLKPTRDFRRALRKRGISLIAEVKKASPSRGDLLEGVEPVDLANAYSVNGARAISVLTDERFFKGKLEDLTAVWHDVEIPCLRKDFIIDEYQIYEARVAHADAILLIVRILSDQQIKDYLELATSLDMAVLVETHDANEIERALKNGAHIIGINNRDLATFEVDISTTLELRKLVPGGNVLVSESGIRTAEDVRALEAGGVDAVLVGETLVTSENIGAKVRELLSRDES